ncbi:hypothetical protein [Krasilnikoviella flava]|uniref:hypothetical protein n=1 Tax=Krasilnikoviella flava TaxID=526729 RepID=UPI00111C0BF2|nr:hypothetical protein [Krasilnikoviella flava]
MKRTALSTATALVISGVIVAGTALPAQAAIYTWFDRNGTAGTRYYDHVVGSQADSFSRTGVHAEVDGSGYTWQTSVWFGSYTTTGSASATITGPRSFNKTSFRITNAVGTGSIGMKAWLTDARMAGFASSDAAELEPDPEVSSSGSAGEIAADEIRADSVEGRDITKVGADEQVEFWASESDDAAEICLYTTWEEYAAYTCEESSAVQAVGIRSEASGPEFESELEIPAENERTLSSGGSLSDGVTFSVNHLD